MDFQSLYREFSPRVYRLCLGYLNDQDLAKDLTQEAFISIWENLDSFRGDAAIGTWIYRIATNKCLRHIENHRRCKEVKFDFQLDDKAAEPVEDLNLKFLRNCIADLNELDRLIIGLYLEEVKQEMIAEIVGISHSNIRVRIHRIKKELSDKFRDHGKF